jgi:hypothetical protein
MPPTEDRHRRAIWHAVAVPAWAKALLGLLTAASVVVLLLRHEYRPLLSTAFAYLAVPFAAALLLGTAPSLFTNRAVRSIAGTDGMSWAIGLVLLGVGNLWGPSWVRVACNAFLWIPAVGLVVSTCRARAKSDRR